MKHFILLVGLALGALSIQAQDRWNTLEELQQALDELHEEAGGDQAEVATRKIDKEIKQINRLIKQRDSLQLLLELTKAELGLCQASKARVDIEKGKLEHLTDSMTVKGFHIVSHTSAHGDTTLLKGHYVVLASSRENDESVKQYEKIQKKDDHSNLMIVQNKRKTWFHVCMREPYTKASIGGAVHIARKKGHQDAWSIELN